LLADDVADRVVLDPAQLAGVEAARGEVVARLEEGLRAEQAARRGTAVSCVRSQVCSPGRT